MQMTCVPTQPPSYSTPRSHRSHIDSNGKGHELRAGIHADDLRANSTTLLLDTSITQITGNSRDPTHRPQARQGKRHPNADPM